MQQLIDKQVLLQALKRKRYSKQSLDLIESQPVVIAVPIDWIHDYLNETFLPESHFWVIQKMIKQWEKENEKDI